LIAAPFPNPIATPPHAVRILQHHVGQGHGRKVAGSPSPGAPESSPSRRPRFSLDMLHRGGASRPGEPESRFGSPPRVGAGSR
jgi:hypothetical protein